MIAIIGKLFKDCIRNKGKVLLMVFASILSSWGISSVVFTYFMSERDFEVNFENTFPADIEILIGDFNQNIPRLLHKNENIVAIERREVVSGSIKNSSDKWMPLILFGTEDINNMKLNVFSVLDWNKDYKSILIETNASYFLEDDIKFANIQIQGVEFFLPIGGISHDPRLAPARMERSVFAHVPNLELLKPFLNENERRFLIKTNAGTDKSEILKISKSLEKDIAEAGGKVIAISIPEPGKHMHQNIVDGVSFLQRNLGIIVALMGIVLLSLILLTWLFPQIADIGTMKAIGAPTNAIFIGYLILISCILICGLVPGIVFGYFTAIGYNQLIAFIQNFRVVTEILPYWVFVITSSLSLIIPIGCMIITIRKVVRTSVQEAISKTFYTPNNSLLIKGQLLVSNPKAKYILNNLFRNSFRTILVILLISTGTALFFTGSGLQYSVSTELESIKERTNYGLWIDFNEKLSYEYLNFINELPEIKSLSPTQDQRVSYRPPNSSFYEASTIRSIDQNFQIGNNFVLRGSIKKNCSDCFYVCGEEMKQKFEHVPLDSLFEFTLPDNSKISLTFSGVLKNIGVVSAPLLFIKYDGIVYADGLGIQSDSDYSELEEKIVKVLNQNDIEYSRIRNMHTQFESLKEHLQPTFLIIKSTGLITLVLGCIGIFIVLKLSIQERTREIGIMKSLGAVTPDVSSLFSKEFILVCALSTCFGLLLSYPLITSICEVITETVIYQQIPPKQNLFTIFLTFTVLLISLLIAITVHNHYKIQKNARELLDFSF